jgi:hypothetical protein
MVRRMGVRSLVEVLLMDKGRTFASIAAEVGVTRERVRQIAKAIGAESPVAKNLDACAKPGCRARGRLGYALCAKHLRWLLGQSRRDRSARRCDVAGCDREHYARGMCMTHYAKWRLDNIPGLRARHNAYVRERRARLAARPLRAAEKGTK